MLTHLADTVGVGKFSYDRNPLCTQQSVRVGTGVFTRLPTGRRHVRVRASLVSPTALGLAAAVTGPGGSFSSPATAGGATPQDPAPG